MDNPKVSIIVPVYNVEKYIHRCIDSILKQTFTEFECILVDDCSPDNSPKICDDYAKQDARVKVIHKPQNEGLPFARRTGFNNSSGDYIQFVDSDDWIEPDMTEKLYTAAAYSNADIVVCDYYINNEQNYRYVIQPIDTENLLNNLGFVNNASVWNKFFHRNIIKLIEFPKTEKYEDRVTTQQALYYAKNIVKISIPLYHYFSNNESISKKINVEKYIKWRKNILYVINFLQSNLKEKFILKENNINDYLNKYKLKVLRNGLIFKDKSLFFFYPKSKFLKWLLFKLIKEGKYLILPYCLYLHHQKQKK
jgi:glycosyltransferase involved in cell wall biosynthesis